MIIPPVITRIRAHGGEIALVGDALRLKAPASLREEVIAEIKAHKDAIRHALRAEAGQPWDAEDHRYFYEERAAIAEYDGGLPRLEAETRAFESCVTEWLSHNVLGARAGYCAQCGGNGSPENQLLPFGAEPSGHTWLHAGCWGPWFNCRRAEAANALAAMGILAKQGGVS